MRFHISFEVFESLIEDSAVAAAQAQAGKTFAGFLSDPRVSSCGHFVSKRGGYIVIDVDSVEEIAELIGQHVDYVRFDIQPVLGFDKLLEFFEKEAQARQAA